MTMLETRAETEWPARLTICGLSELPTFTASGVTHVLSLLDPQAPEMTLFKSFGPIHRKEIRFDDIVSLENGYHAPEEHHVTGILEFGEELRRQGKKVLHLLVHCHMGISRSTAAMAIILSQLRPGEEESAFLELFRIRPRAWPNSRLIQMADRLLDRRGTLVDALKRHQSRIIFHHPDIAGLVTDVGRGHELPRKT